MAASPSSKPRPARRVLGGGPDQRVLTLNFRSINGDMTGVEYLTRYLPPNVDVHIATAHGILRNQGLAIGKKDYFGVA